MSIQLKKFKYTFNKRKIGKLENKNNDKRIKQD